VASFVEKPAPGTAPSNLINAGTYVLEPSVLDRIEPGVPCSIERAIFPAIAGAGGLFAVRSDAYWIDAGTPEAYLTAQLDLLDGLRRGGAEAGVHPDAQVAESAEVSRSVIADGATVDDSAVVANSIVMAGATVGAGAVVRDSIVGWDSSIASGATLADLTVIGSGQQVDAGAKLSSDRVPSADTWT
jgi:mannose-1-phosphate guanylyltransferase